MEPWCLVCAHQTSPKKKYIADNVVHGSLADLEESASFNVAIGRLLADALGVGIGHEIGIVVPNTVSTLLGSIPRIKKFTVSAIFASQRSDIDSTSVLMSLENAQKLFSMGNSVTYLELYSTHPYSPEKLAKSLQDGLEEEYSVRTWLQNFSSFMDALYIERVAMFTILSLIVLVAAFNIISSLFMLVHDKKREIAIIRTFGASRMHVMCIFMMTGSFIGLIGTGAGVLLGVGIAANLENIQRLLEHYSGLKLFDAMVYYLEHLPVRIDYGDVGIVASISLAFSLLATIYPAYKASTFEPAQSLKYE